MKHITQETLQKLTVPTVSMKMHKMQLKQALLAAEHSNKTRRIKGEWRNIMTKKKFIVSGATIAIAVLAVVAFSIFDTQSPAAYAAQLTAQSLNTVSKLSPNQQQAINERVHGNIETDLQAAEHAQNLTVLTYAELMQQYPQVGSGITSGPTSAPPVAGIPTQIDPGSLKYLRYTDAQGTTHIIGVNPQGLPVMEMAFNNNGNTSQSTMMIQADGSNGPAMSFASGSVRVDGGAAGQEPAGLTCSNTAGDDMHCTGGPTSPNGATCMTSSAGTVQCSAAGSATTGSATTSDN